MFNTRTKLYAVIGDPVAHSLSPLMQNWMIKHFGLNAAYMAFRVKNEELKLCIDGMKALEIAGFNVTIPHKENILSFVDDKTSDVTLLGVCNTLKNAAGKIIAHVTDPYGFIESLGENRAIFDNASVVLIGAGGGAHSVVYALSHLGVQKLYITDTVFERCLKLSHLAMHTLKISEVTAISTHDPALNDAVAESAVLINASPAGMHPHAHSLPFHNLSIVTKKHFVYDLVYNPGMTRLLKEAQARGAIVQNGLDMLIFQGLQSLRIWQDDDFQLNESALAELRNSMKAELKAHE